MVYLTQTTKCITTYEMKWVGLFHETERYRPKPTETGPKNANRGPINYIYTIV